uniref:Uncharacterized protein n=1 Tax=Pelusios castaneus TaxID=367368 RepID=A0A8C8VQU2_9SAUR
MSPVVLFKYIVSPGDKDNENLVLCSLTSNKTQKGKGSNSLAASFMKDSGSAKVEQAQAPNFSLQEGNTLEYSLPLVQNTQGSNISLLNCTLPQAQSDSKSECTAIERTAAGETEDSLSISFTQDSEGNRVLAHRNAVDSVSGRVSVANGKTSRKRVCHWIEEGHLCSKRGRMRVGLKPEHLMKQGRKRWKNLSPAGISFMDFPEAENVCPALKGNEDQQTNCSVPKGQKAKAEPLRESQNFASFWTNCYNKVSSAEEPGDNKSSPTKQLFTQDSEGYRVISHQHFYENVSSQKKYPQDKPNFVDKGTTPISVGCFRVYSSGAWDRTPVATNIDEPESCYDSLFTEDSEGNRIIKH